MSNLVGRKSSSRLTSLGNKGASLLEDDPIELQTGITRGKRSERLRVGGREEWRGEGGVAGGANRVAAETMRLKIVTG